MTDLSPEVKKVRHATYPIHSIFLNRWSPRSMSGEDLSDEELLPLFEAARWAPSCYNNQPWRFLYGKRNTPEWDLFYSLLAEGNKTWCEHASVLLLIISHNTYERNNKPAVTHSYDTGAAWMSLCLEGFSRGLVIHGMAGFDYEKAPQVLNIPEGYTVEAMAAIGKKASKEELTPELQKIETPSNRKPLSDIIKVGKFS